MSLKKPKHSETCVYCGSSAGTSDYVPPRSFFPKPRPSNLITVPCCRRCNQRKEKDEEFFLATFMFSDAAQTKVGQELWVEKMNRLYFRGRGVGSAIRKRMRPLNLVTPSGLYAGKSIGVEIDYDRLDSVVKNVVRGLYYEEFGEAIASSAEVECNWLNSHSLFQTTLPHVKDLRFGKIWPGVFEYRGDRVPEQPSSSIWVMRFFEHAIYWAITGEQENAAND
ncbi:MAG TPA: hypothetical protein PKG49_09075 [Nitrosomonas mobilis]|nr:hypothetical protein [Nitrosomonas mobilis]